MLPSAIQARFDTLVASGELPLPLLPETAAQVLAMVDRPTCDAWRLSELVRRDPAMTAHVMQIAASPVYATSVKVTSLQQAIGRLGFAAISQLALAIAAKARVFSVKGYDTELRAAFKHALATALFAQEIARLRRSTVDIAFLAGLFHDFGQPVLLQALVDLAGADVGKDDLLAAVEAKHAEVGAALVVKWQMPAKVAEAVRLHHAPAGCELAALVALADHFAHGKPEAPPAELAVALNMYPEDLEAIAARAPQVFETAQVIA
ncbi:MAG TPA: HDOD domain-containing protein [Kofleriaceae bacterium]|jgi:putative nucleotidyltransferase with HDIG domain|nr:HDOD domain-containing protein [Kofleriaceae bacterium]